MLSVSNSLISQALEALKAQDRLTAAALLYRDLEEGPKTGERWRSVAQLARTIGEKRLEQEALWRLTQTEPKTLDKILAYGQSLTRLGQTQDALRMLDTLPVEAQDHPSVLHFRAMAASESGDFVKAESLFRHALAKAPGQVQSWHGLAVIKTFKSGDPDMSAMETMLSEMDRSPAELRSLLLFALGKAWHDVGDFARAAKLYDAGAALRQAEAAGVTEAWDALVDQTIHDYTPAALSQLKQSGCDSSRIIFVNGLPRSGTTLVEQILTAHTSVVGGGELNLTDHALMPAGDCTLAGALAYQKRSAAADPWGDIARDYLRMVEDHFGPDRSNGRVVDKTLNRSQKMGLLLHMMPQARVVWVRRNPEDCALSIFRTQFSGSMQWSWSLADIAAHMRGEDRLYAHWSALFPDRILTVPYEELVAQPDAWIRRILGHVGLIEEHQVFSPHEQERVVTSASTAQVRAPISTSRVGAADAYGDFMTPFRQAYYD